MFDIEKDMENNDIESPVPEYDSRAISSEGSSPIDYRWGTVAGPFERVPKALGDMAPGPILAAFLSAVNVHTLRGWDRLSVLRAHARMVAHYQAALMEDIASIPSVCADGDSAVDMAAIEAAAAEVGAILTLTTRATDCEMETALQLTGRHPQVLETLRRGDIDLRSARAIIDGCLHLDDLRAAEVSEAILEDAADLTTGQIRARMRRLCADLEPEDAARRYEVATNDRRVALHPTDAGTASIIAFDLPPDRATLAMDRIESIARSLRTPEEPRTLDQLRSDVFLDLLVGSHAARRSPDRHLGSIDLVVNLETLVGLADRSAELGGYGPVVADIARQVAEGSTDMQWTYTITDPVTGQPIATGSTRRRPSTAQRRRINARYRTCVFPGCRRPSSDSDLDHRVDWAHGGPTTDENLAPLCRRHHGVKHTLGWSYRKDADRIIWTSALGRTYVTSGAPP